MNISVLQIEDMYNLRERYFRDFGKVMERSGIQVLSSESETFASDVERMSDAVDMMGYAYSEYVWQTDTLYVWPAFLGHVRPAELTGE